MIQINRKYWMNLTVVASLSQEFRNWRKILARKLKMPVLISRSIDR